MYFDIAVRSKVQVLLDHIAKSGALNAGWYVGIAKAPEDRLFNDHKVSKNNGWWIYDKFPNSDTARKVEQYLHSLGFDGGPSGGSSATVYVYAYKKETWTVE